MQVKHDEKQSGKKRIISSQGDVTRDDSQQRFLAQHSVATLLRHCFEWLQHCSNIATLCCAKNRRCESSRVTLPLNNGGGYNLYLIHHPSDVYQEQIYTF